MCLLRLLEMQTYHWYNFRFHTFKGGKKHAKNPTNFNKNELIFDNNNNNTTKEQCKLLNNIVDSGKLPSNRQILL